jgi:hypothetical protein
LIMSLLYLASISPPCPWLVVVDQISEQHIITL